MSTHTVTSARPASPSVLSVLLRVVALIGVWVALGALLYRAPTAAENAVNIGAGFARLVGLVLAVVAVAALDARRHGYARAVRTTCAVLVTFALLAVGAAVVSAVTGGPDAAGPVGAVLMIVVASTVGVLVPAGALAVAAAALADRGRRHPA